MPQLITFPAKSSASPLQLSCPICHAAEGQECTGLSGRFLPRFHAPRVEIFATSYFANKGSRDPVVIVLPATPPQTLR
ncbi:MAG TPA: hypothetical protein VGL89_17180 [Candidatus Koribacter sp.]|jgi:hypothetical protein